MSAGGYTARHVGSNRRVRKRCGSGVKKGKSRSINGRNGSPESSKGEWICLLIRNLDAWLERGHRQMNFYLMQVMSSHGAFNVYLFRMKLVESPNCSNCDRRGRDDDAWYTLFECLAFQLYWEEAMTALQKTGQLPLTRDSLVPIMLKNAEGWDQVAAFITLTMRHKMEIAQEWQGWPIVAATQHPMRDLIPPIFAISNSATEAEEDNPDQSTSVTPDSQSTM